GENPAERSKPAACALIASAAAKLCNIDRPARGSRAVRLPIDHSGSGPTEGQNPTRTPALAVAVRLLSDITVPSKAPNMDMRLSIVTSKPPPATAPTVLSLPGAANVKFCP